MLTGLLEITFIEAIKQKPVIEPILVAFEAFTGMLATSFVLLFVFLVFSYLFRTLYPLNYKGHQFLVPKILFYLLDS